MALTFDDGPDPVWTPRVLDELARLDVRATFFPLSPRAQRNPELVARIRAEGHTVGLHGWAHLKHPKASRAEVEEDTDRALAALDPRPRLWRLPYGMPAPWSRAVAADRDLEVVGFNRDTHDWRGDRAGEMLFEPDAGDVVLMHDAVGPGARRGGCAETVALIGPLVDRARARGLEAVALG